LTRASLRLLLGPYAMRTIGRELRQLYADIIAEGVPEHFIAILRRLDEPNNEGSKIDQEEANGHHDGGTAAKTSSQARNSAAPSPCSPTLGETASPERSGWRMGSSS